MASNLVKVDVLAKFFNREPRTVQLWAKNNGMPKESPGKYDFLKCIKWRLEALEEENNILRNAGDERLHALKTETQRVILAERKERYKKYLGELVDMEMVRIAWLSEISYFKKAMNAVKTKLLNSLEGVTEKNAQMIIINREINEALLSMSEELRIDSEIEEEEETEENGNTENS